MLTMKKADYEKILAHAKENLPEEACGLIAGTKDGDKKIIEKVYLLENVDHTNEHFSMNPKEQLAAVKDMRTNHLVPLGNWDIDFLFRLLLGDEYELSAADFRYHVLAYP